MLCKQKILVCFIDERWSSLRKLQKRRSVIRRKWKGAQLITFKCDELPSKYCLNVYIISYISVGLKLWRKNTTESGRRTMVLTDPRALNPVQRSHHQEPPQLQRPKVLVRTDSSVFFLKCMNPVFRSETSEALVFYFIHPVSLRSLSLCAAVCCAAFYDLFFMLMKSTLSLRKMRRMRRTRRTEK